MRLVGAYALGLSLEVQADRRLGPTKSGCKMRGSLRAVLRKLY